MNFSIKSYSVDVNESFKQDLLEGKYDQKWVILLFVYNHDFNYVDNNLSLNIKKTFRSI